MTKSQKAQAQKAIQVLQDMAIAGKTQGEFMEIENLLKQAEKTIKAQRAELDAVTLDNGMKKIELRTANIPAKAAYVRESEYKVWA